MINDKILNILRKYQNAEIIRELYRDIAYNDSTEFGIMREVIYVLPGKKAYMRLDEEEEKMESEEVFEYRLSEISYEISKQLPNFDCDKFDLESGNILENLSNLKRIL